MNINDSIDQISPYEIQAEAKNAAAEYQDQNEDKKTSEKDQEKRNDFQKKENEKRKRGENNQKGFNAATENSNLFPLQMIGIFAVGAVAAIKEAIAFYKSQKAELAAATEKVKENVVEKEAQFIPRADEQEEQNDQVVERTKSKDDELEMRQ